MTCSHGAVCAALRSAVRLADGEVRVLDQLERVVEPEAAGRRHSLVELERAGPGGAARVADPDQAVEALVLRRHVGGRSRAEAVAGRVAAERVAVPDAVLGDLGAGAVAGGVDDVVRSAAGQLHQLARVRDLLGRPVLVRGVGEEALDLVDADLAQLRRDVGGAVGEAAARVDVDDGVRQLGERVDRVADLVDAGRTAGVGEALQRDQRVDLVEEDDPLVADSGGELVVPALVGGDVGRESLTPPHSRCLRR